MRLVWLSQKTQQTAPKYCHTRLALCVRDAYLCNRHYSQMLNPPPPKYSHIAIPFIRVLVCRA